jgi:hypothetical protein
MLFHYSPPTLISQTYEHIHPYGHVDTTILGRDNVPPPKYKIVINCCQLLDTYSQLVD